MRLQADYYELATATSGWFFGLVTLNSAVLPLLCLYQLKNPKNPGRTKKKRTAFAVLFLIRWY
jgi:hypothetical protein